MCVCVCVCVFSRNSDILTDIKGHVLYGSFLIMRFININNLNYPETLYTKKGHVLFDSFYMKYPE